MASRTQVEAKRMPRAMGGYIGALFAIILFAAACSAEVPVADTLAATVGAPSTSTPERTVATEPSEPPVAEAPSADDSTATDDPPPAPLPVCGRYLPDDGYSDDFEIVDCTDPHDSEFAGQYVDIGGGDSVRTPESDAARVVGCGVAVAELTGRPVSLSGIVVGIDENRQDGSDVVYDCWARVTVADLLTASMTERPLTDQLPADARFPSDAVVGECYTTPTDEAELFFEADCENADADAYVGAVQLVGDATEFDDDQVTNQAFMLCDEAFGDGYTTIFYPDERGWTAGQRDVHCTFNAAWAAEYLGDASYCLYIDTDESQTEVDCSDGHNVEFAGTVPAPFDTWPETEAETELALLMACIDVVETHYGRPLLPVLRLAALPVADPDYGGPADTSVDCYARTQNGYPAFTGFVPDIGLEAALGDIILIADLEPGTCFTWIPPDFYSFGYTVDCTSDGAIVHIGTFIGEDRPYPGLDELRIERQAKCQELLEASGLSVDEATILGTVPTEFMWGLDVRLITCEASPS